MTIKVAVANDHGGYPLKEYLKENLDHPQVEWVDLGCNSEESVDYPEYGYSVARSVAEGEADVGIAICGSGLGISMAVNRDSRIRGAVCTNTTMAELTRQHNDANVLCLGARITGEVLALDIVKTFLTTEFEGGRHERRIKQLTEGAV